MDRCGRKGTPVYPPRSAESTLAINAGDMSQPDRPVQLLRILSLFGISQLVCTTNTGIVYRT